jgi:hypothetical protein
MNKTAYTGLSIKNFRIWDYPIFAILLGYVWVELTNPILAYSLQMIPKIPNSAIALIICYFVRPDYIKQIRVPFNPVKWALPFLIIATINLPFVQYAQDRSVLELTSDWFWVLFLLPLTIRVLATPSGRWHYLLFSAISLMMLSWTYFIALNNNQYILVIKSIELNYHQLSVNVIPLLPILLGYYFLNKGFSKFFVILCLIILLIVVIPAGARSMWLILPVESLVMVLLVLPRSRFIVTVVVISFVFLFSLPLVNISDLYSIAALQNFQTRISKAEHWQEDNSVWTRFGMVIKTKMILEEYPLLGIGYSNRSFASYDAGIVNFMGHSARVLRYDAHNTYLNILGGTGILGFFAFLYYMRQVFIVLRKIPVSLWRGLEYGPFLVGAAGSLVFYFADTLPFERVAQTTALIMGLYLYHYNLQEGNPVAGEK